MSPVRNSKKQLEISNGVSKFDCQKCGDCCKWIGYTYITEDDVKTIAKHLSLSEFEFVNRYAEIIHRPRLNLKMKENGECIFLEGNDCTIQTVKPKQCVDFPAVWKVKDLESFCRGQKRISRKDTGRA